MEQSEKTWVLGTFLPTFIIWYMSHFCRQRHVLTVWVCPGIFHHSTMGLTIDSAKKFAFQQFWKSWFKSLYFWNMWIWTDITLIELSNLSIKLNLMVSTLLTLEHSYRQWAEDSWPLQEVELTPLSPHLRVG